MYTLIRNMSVNYVYTNSQFSHHTLVEGISTSISSAESSSKLLKYDLKFSLMTINYKFCKYRYQCLGSKGICANLENGPVKSAQTSNCP